MALQGSIDTFALDDVLRLVAGTGKTGRFSLTGPRGEGALVVRDGQVLDGSVSTDERAYELTELVFELLRFDEGDFAFDAVDVDGYEDAEATEVEALIAEASDMLEEWRDIEAVVPTTGALITLAADGPDHDVTVSPTDWRVIAAVGAGATVAELSERLDASQLSTGRLLRSLVETGLLTAAELDEVAIGGFGDHPEGAIAFDTGLGGDGLDRDGFAAFDGEPGPVDVPEGNGNGNGHGDVDAEVLFESVHEFAIATVEVPESEGAESSAEALDAAEFARRLAELPPRAAKAVAAAARADSVEEREAALAELDGTGEEVDHEALLQLLGPVEG